MASKADRFYFENISAAAESACKAANYLEKCLSDFHPERLSTMLDEMHVLEHSGDTKKHEMSAALARAFVTPLEREDLALISQNVDEVTDSIEEVLQAFYMYQLNVATPEAVQFAKKISESCLIMKQMLDELVNFKKPEKLHKLIIELNNTEEDCDKLYMDAVRHLNVRFQDAVEIVSWRDVYKRLEACADATEHVGDCVDTIVMKNT